MSRVLDGASSLEARGRRSLPASLTPEALSALDEIVRDGVLVAHVPRPLDLGASLEPWIAARNRDETLGWEHTGEATSFGSPDVSSKLVSALPQDVAEVIVADLRVLAPRVARWTSRRHVRARLEVVRNDACRKFHHDYVAMRLLVTYLGPGTEWLPEDASDRRFLGRHDLDAEASNAGLVRDPSRVCRARAGDVVVLKGAAHPSTHGRGAIHRSPPIERDPATAGRLVLRIDVASCTC